MMDSTQNLLDHTVDIENQVEGDDTNEKITDLAFRLLINSQFYKQPRMNQIRKYEKLYLNDVPPKLRQLFNIPVPIFAGMLDTLLADFNDPVDIRFVETNPAQFLVLPKVQSQWEAEKKSIAPNAMWDQKARWDRFNAAMSGRGILKFYAESDPKYRSILETVYYGDFHCQPLGGGNLENHTFVGQEGILRTLEDIVSDEKYDSKQREKLKNFAWSSDWWTQIETNYGTQLQRFKSQGLDVQSNTFAGDRTLNLCEFGVTYKGERYYVLFEPLTKIWLRVEKLSDLFPSNRWPWVSWATHEDSRNFWSKAFSDDLYYVSDAVITLMNQELTNREKRNFNARAFDQDMFTDVAKLDAAQYRPDALVPVEVEAGKNLQNGIYTFTTPELQGTLDLVSFLEREAGTNVGVSNLSMGQMPRAGTVKASVVMAQQQQMAKRIGFRSDSYQEAWTQIGSRYLEGLKMHMPSKLAVKIIGDSGFTEEHELKRVEFKRAGDIGVKTVSTSKQERDDMTKKDSQSKALQMILNSPNVNAKWRDEQILRLGQWDDSDISAALDTQSFTSKKSIAYASQALQDILAGKKPEMWFGADMAYLEYLHNFARDNKSSLKDNYQELFRFITQVAPIVHENMQRKAKDVASGRAQSPEATGQQSGANQPMQQPGKSMGMNPISALAARGG